ncbi:hypothetical protein [Granulicella sibirica]|uniref:SpoVT-AbrB domain-containing protein n=1 Tax=Granulicella sibirica TaxID=2479048 RepID=A0A4Q0SY12_9BACT|nr:hypothetical protein [Granulicella sibirica]RXH56083.1 hypothetical protein GRAN_2940 [Granulicella sibirica]
MNRNAVVISSDGKLEVPKEVQEEMHLSEEARLRLVSSSSTGFQAELD